MKHILNIINHEKKALEKTDFIKWLAKKESHAFNKFLYSPNMTFFILGFRDILTLLKIENPKTGLEQIVNDHCDEDLEHWTWYLQDLKKLGFNLQHWGNDIPTFFDTFWSDKNIEVRKLVYKSIHYSLRYDDPKLKIVMIEVMEATFGAFMKALAHSIKGDVLFDQLLFFGQNHLEAESNHSQGSWIDEDGLDSTIRNIELSYEQKAQSLLIVDELFSQFNDMFQCWLKIQQEQELEYNKDVVEQPILHIQEESTSLEI